MKYTIGDTPEQLNTKLAHIDSALVVDGLVYTQETVRQLKSERDALAARIEMLQKHIERVALCYYNNTGNEPSLSVFHRALDEAESAVFKESHQHLAEIRAEAVLQFAGTVLAKYRYDITEWAKIEANKIRQGGVK